MIQVQLSDLKDTRRKRKTIREISQSVSFALDRFQHAIRDVNVSVVDINGPRGGWDKVCRVMLRLKPRGVLVVSGKGTSNEHAAQEAVKRLSERLSRTLSRQRTAARRWRRRVTLKAIGDG